MGTAHGTEAMPCWKGFTNHCHTLSERLIQLGLAVKPGEIHTGSWDPVFSELSWEVELPFMCFILLSTVAHGEGTAQGVPGVGMEMAKQNTRHWERTNHTRQTPLCLEIVSVLPEGSSGWRLPRFPSAPSSSSSRVQCIPRSVLLHFIPTLFAK